MYDELIDEAEECNQDTVDAVIAEYSANTASCQLCKCGVLPLPCLHACRVSGSCCGLRRWRRQYVVGCGLFLWALDLPLRPRGRRGSGMRSLLLRAVMGLRCLPCNRRRARRS